MLRILLIQKNTAFGCSVKEKNYLSVNGFKNNTIYKKIGLSIKQNTRK